mmetsp:Transcript_39534/g.38019  ORF Transcript_39534/g.38019 Transcript_39534/m.38019 type:complete len:95 (+) Transcript_39534:324-608(+)
MDEEDDLENNIADEMENHVMMEKTNNLDAQDPKGEEEILSQKLQVLYNTNPLNVIPETWEQESKNSMLHDSQAMHMLGKNFNDLSLTNEKLKKT